MTRSCTNRVALVTGAAGGIGAATVAKLVDEGALVVAMDLDGPGLERLRQATPLPDRLIALTGDAAARKDMDEAVGIAVAKGGQLDIAVFNAGVVGVSCPIRDYPVDEFDRVMRVNVHGPWHGIQSAVPAMKRRGGSIVLTSSINGIRGFATFGAYAASKQAVMGLARTAAIDLARYGIRVNSVHPGLVETAMMRNVESMVAPAAPGEAHDTFAALVPLGRYCEPREIASAIAFLASDEASYVTGSTCVADGGFTTGIPA